MVRIPVTGTSDDSRLLAWLAMLALGSCAVAVLSGIPAGLPPATEFLDSRHQFRGKHARYFYPYEGVHGYSCHGQGSRHGKTISPDRPVFPFCGRLDFSHAAPDLWPIIEYFPAVMMATGVAMAALILWILGQWIFAFWSAARSSV